MDEKHSECIQCPMEGCQSEFKTDDNLYVHVLKCHKDYNICGRCADGHGDIEFLLLDELYADEYYEYVCSECHGYLLENQ